MKKRILVTGGTGFIGSHTVVELLSAGYEVVIVDDLSNSKMEVLEGIETITGIKPEFYQYDVSNANQVDALFNEAGHIDAVIHFAASKAVGESVQKPLLYYRNNVGSLVYLLDAMKRFKVNELVFSSSCTVYGQPDKLPVTEQTPFKPAESPYGNTKQICEEILRDVCRSDKDVLAISLRYFNPVGAHPSALIGELPKGLPNNLVPYITQTAIGIRKELLIFGNDYSTPDGSAIRDYIHVVDLAKAHVLAVDRLMHRKNQKNFEYFNLGTGSGLSVLEIVETFQRVNHVKVNYRIVDRRPGDVEQIYADTGLANRELGWTANLDVSEMLESAWKWQLYLKDHPELSD